MLKNTWSWVRTARTRWSNKHKADKAGAQTVAGGTDAAHPMTAPVYSPKNVGNDASARPWERQHGGEVFDAAVQAGSHSTVGTASPSGRGLPVGWDEMGFLRLCETNFRSLQAAWDSADTASVRRMMTPAMLQAIAPQLAEREQHADKPHPPAELVTLRAHLLSIEEQAACYLASVEFDGLIREDESAGPSPFREIWSITQDKPGAAASGAPAWLVAGVQALQ
ncbi:MAG: hypothetical protein RLZZ352_833 [Pseudomonadota bacterium]